MASSSSTSATEDAAIYGIRLDVAVGMEWALCADAIQRYHYLRTFPDPRCMPVVYSVRLAGEWVGCVVFGRPESNRRYSGELTYGSLADVASGRAKFDRWTVLNLARVWLSPSVQTGGALCSPGRVPGFCDRRGVFRSTFASTAVREAIALIRLDYLMVYPPCFVEEPYQIRAILSYCDTRIHRGVLYRAAGFAHAGVNKSGVETWYFDRVPPLDEEQDRAVRAAARFHDRSRRKRAARGAIDLQETFRF